MSPVLLLSALFGWLAISVGLGYLASRKLREGPVEFFLGGRRIGGFVAGMTYAATTYSAFMLVGLVGLTYRDGVGALGFELIYLMFTMVFLLVFAPRFWVTAARHGIVSPSELLELRYRSVWSGRAATIISFVMLVPYASAQLIGSGLLLEQLSDGALTFELGVGMTVAVAIIGAVWAGMHSVSLTDAVQGMVMLVSALIVLAVIVWSVFGGAGSFISTVEGSNARLLAFDWDVNYFIGLTLPWAFFAITNPQVSQRTMIARSPLSLRRMIVYFSIFGFLYTLVSVLFGFAAREMIPGLDNPDNAMPILLTLVPDALGLIMFVGIFAAATSTLGSIFLTLGSLLARESVLPGGRRISERRQRMLGRVAIAALAAVCIWFANLRPGLITVLSSMASGGLLMTAPALIGCFYSERGSSIAALVSMSMAVPVGIAYAVNWYPLGIWPPVWGIALSSVLYILLSLKFPDGEYGRRFIGGVHADLASNGFRRE